MSRRVLLIGMFLGLVLLGGCGEVATSTPASTPTEKPTATVTGITGGTRVCGSSDLRAEAGWQGAGGALVGQVSFTNQSSTPCALQGHPQVELLDAKDKPMPTDEVSTTGAGTAGPVVVQPGQKAVLPFQWRNWCDSPPGGAVSLLVELPGGQDKIVAPARDPNGAPLSDTPRFDASGSNSALAVGNFEASS